MTVVILIVFSLVVTAQQFIGDPIDCIVTKDVPGNMMDTYCWSVPITFILRPRVAMLMTKFGIFIFLNLATLFLTNWQLFITTRQKDYMIFCEVEEL